MGPFAAKNFVCTFFLSKLFLIFLFFFFFFFFFLFFLFFSFFFFFFSFFLNFPGRGDGLRLPPPLRAPMVSSKFQVTNIVRQGSVLSPLLFLVVFFVMKKKLPYVVTRDVCLSVLCRNNFGTRI